MRGLKLNIVYVKQNSYRYHYKQIKPENMYFYFCLLWLVVKFVYWCIKDYEFWDKKNINI